MLVLHPSSRCDVCLDAYNWDSPDQTPHAIPCGHIFCKTCLAAVNPPNCPLCRKTFIPLRIKRLHVDRPESLDEHRQVDFLQRLALSWDAPEDQLEELLNEVETWLNSRDDEANFPLRKAREAAERYQRLKKRKEHDRKKLRYLEHQLQKRDQTTTYERDTTKAVEDSLLAQVAELETKVAVYESEVEVLTAELSRYKHSKNPLPPPPEPIPLDRFPAFLQAAASGPGPGYLEDSGRRPLAITNGPTRGFQSDTYDRYGYDTENEVPVNSDAEAQRKRDLKGKGRAHDIYHVPTQIATRATGNRLNGSHLDGYLPGATPQQRLVPVRDVVEVNMSDLKLTPKTPKQPRESSNVDPARDFTDPYTLTAAYLADYASGYVEGYQNGASHKPAAPSVAPSGQRILPNIYGPPAPTTPFADANNYPSRPTATNTLLLLNEPLTDKRASLIRRPAIRKVSGGSPPQELVEASNSFPGTPHSLISGSSSSLPVTFANHGQRDSFISISRVSVTTDESRNSRPYTARTTSEPVPQTNNPTRSSPRRATPESDVQILQPANIINSTPRSTHTVASVASSWGTVSTQPSERQSIGSFGEIGLRGFSEAGLFNSSNTSLLSNPFPLLVEDDEDTRETGNRTPTGQSSWPVSDLLGVRPGRSRNPPREVENQPPGQRPVSYQTPSRHSEDERPQNRRISYPSTPSMQILAAPQGSRHTQAIFSEPSTEPSSQQSRRNSHRHRYQRRVSSLLESIDSSDRQPSATAPPVEDAHWSGDAGYYTDAPPSSTSPSRSFGNALGLALNEPSGPPAITAPTPVVSSRGFLRSFSYDNYS